MKIGFIVVLALTNFVHGEEVEERSDKYLPENDFTKEVRPVTESINEYDSIHHGYNGEVNANQGTSNRIGRIMTKPKAQPIEEDNYFAVSFQQPSIPSYDHIGSANVIYKPYPLFIKSFERSPQVNYESSFGAIKRKESRPFVPSPQIFEGEYGTAGFKNAEFRSNGYTMAQYTPKSTTWVENQRGNIHRLGQNVHEFGTGKELSSVVDEYAGPSTNRNKFEAIRVYNPVFSGYRAPSRKGYLVGNLGAPRSIDFNDYRMPRIISHGSPTVTTFKDVNIPVSAQKIEYNPATLNGYGIGQVDTLIKEPEYKSQLPQQYIPQEYASIPTGGGGNSELVAKIPELSSFGKQQYTNVPSKEFNSAPSENYVPQGFGGQQFGSTFQYVPNITNAYSNSLLSASSFQSSLREIEKMVKEEQRKANGKAIFLIGKPQIPQNMLGNPTPSSQQTISNNAFSNYKY